MTTVSATVHRCACGTLASDFCAFALSGRKAGTSCDAPLCEDCLLRIKGVPLCKPHARLRGVRT